MGERNPAKRLDVREKIRKALTGREVPIEVGEEADRKRQEEIEKNGWRFIRYTKLPETIEIYGE